MIEIAANSVASALAAQEGGAHRIELCAALEIGGLTPSHAQISRARERIRIPMYVLIRPRGGDFVYDDLEFETMLKDIETCVSIGCDGVVVGALDESGYIDMQRCAAMIAAAGKLGVTFHRAFDVSRDLRHALENIIALGCERVLTSGGESTALAGASLIAQLVEQANGRISVMPGSGVDATNIAMLRAQTGAAEFHASAKRMLRSRMSDARNLQGMIEGEVRTDVEQVRALVAAVSAS